MSKSQNVRACWLGSTPYQEAWGLQAEIVAAVRDGQEPDTLLLRDRHQPGAVFDQVFQDLDAASQLFWGKVGHGQRELPFLACHDSAPTRRQPAVAGRSGIARARCFAWAGVGCSSGLARTCVRARAVAWALAGSLGVARVASDDPRA